jgi:hypothetical protein
LPTVFFTSLSVEPRNQLAKETAAQGTVNQVANQHRNQSTKEAVDPGTSQPWNQAPHEPSQPYTVTKAKQFSIYGWK